MGRRLSLAFAGIALLVTTACGADATSAPPDDLDYNLSYVECFHCPFISLAWDVPSSPGIDAFVIERKVADDEPWTPVGVVQDSEGAFQDNTGFAVFRYRVYACAAGGKANYSAAIDAQSGLPRAPRGDTTPTPVLPPTATATPALPP